MKACTINCPSCGASVNLEKDVPRCFCPYCGSQVTIDDGTQRVIHSGTINYRDEAKILELQLQEQARLRAVEAEKARIQEEEKRSKRKKLKFPIALTIFFIFCLIMGFNAEAVKPFIFCYLSCLL